MILPRIGVRNGVSLASGSIIGFCLSLLMSRRLWHWRSGQTDGKGERFMSPPVGQLGVPSSLTEELRNLRRKPLYVGVISAGKYLNTRMTACNRTWASDLPDQVEYYVGSLDGQNPNGLKVVELPGASDEEYPPQGKAFRMLKHICDHHVNEFNWFLRADDDAYFRVDKLLHWLDGLNPEDKLYIGQAGYGREKDKFRLKLHDANFCMGGPGVIFSQAMLKEVCPYIDGCMKDDLTLTTGEEDVEIGRCLYNHVGVRCTSAYEFMNLFYHAYPHEYTDHPYTGDLAKSKWQSVFSKGLSFHHLKKPRIMFSVNKYFLYADIGSQRSQALALSSHLDAVQTNFLSEGFKLPRVPSMTDLVQLQMQQNLITEKFIGSPHDSHTQRVSSHDDQLVWGFSDSGGDYGNSHFFFPLPFSDDVVYPEGHSPCQGETMVTEPQADSDFDLNRFRRSIEHGVFREQIRLVDAPSSRLPCNENVKNFMKLFVDFLSKNLTDGFSMSKFKSMFYSVSPLYGVTGLVTLEVMKRQESTDGVTNLKKLCQVNVNYQFEEIAMEVQHVEYDNSRHLSVIVPLTPIHYPLFQQFMQNFEEVFLKVMSDGNDETETVLQASLYVVTFPDATALSELFFDSPALEPSVVISLFQSKYKNVHIRAVTARGPFSAVKALSVGMQASLEDLDRSKDIDPVIFLTSVETSLFHGLTDRSQVQVLGGTVFFPVPCSTSSDTNQACDEVKSGTEIKWLMDSYSHVYALASSLAPILANSSLTGDMHMLYTGMLRARGKLPTQVAPSKTRKMDVIRSFEPRMKVIPAQERTSCKEVQQKVNSVGDILPSCLL